jgi:hypothetical protein
MKTISQLMRDNCSALLSYSGIATIISAASPATKIAESDKGKRGRCFSFGTGRERRRQLGTLIGGNT